MKNVLLYSYDKSKIANWIESNGFKKIFFEIFDHNSIIETVDNYHLLIIDACDHEEYFLKWIKNNQKILSSKKLVFFYEKYSSVFKEFKQSNIIFHRLPKEINELKFILSNVLKIPTISTFQKFEKMITKPTKTATKTLNEQLYKTTPISKEKFLSIENFIQFQSKDLIKKFFEISSDLMYLYDYELDQYHYLNNSLFDSLNFDPENRKDLYRTIMPSKYYQYYMKTIIPKILSLKDNQYYEFQFTVQTKNRIQMYILAKEFVYSRDKDGTPKLLMGIMSDVSTQYETENQMNQSIKREKLLNEVFHNSPIGIVYSTDSQNLFNPNYSYCQLVGYSKKEIESMSWIDLTPGEYIDEEFEILSLLSPENNYLKYEKEYIHKNGERIPVEVVIFAEFDQNKDIEYYIGFFQDVKARRQNEKKQDYLFIKMNKRINELQCLNRIANLIQKEKDINTIFTQLLTILPSGWQYPSITTIKINYKDYQFVSDNYQETKNILSTDLVINQEKQGSIQVAYLNENFFTDKTPFLLEEQKLLDNIGILISDKIEHIIANQEIKKMNFSLAEEVKERGKDFNKLQNRFELAKKSAEIGVWEWRIKEDKLIWDTLMFKLFGIHPNTFSPKLSEWIKHFAEEEKEHIKMAIQTAIEKKKSFQEDFKIKKENDVERYLRISGHIIKNKKDHATQIVGLAWDVTKTKRLENRLQQEQRRLEEILDSSPITFAISTNNKIVFYNETFHSITGLNIGDHAENLYKNVADRNEILAELDQTGQSIFNDLKINGKDGNVIHTLSYFYKTTFKGKESIKGWLINITELIQAKEELSRARDIAISATQAKTKFLANITHEIRTPMNAILGYSQMLIQDPNLNDKQIKSLQAINRSGELLLSLINEVLDLSKVESGILQIEKETFDFQEVLTEIKEMFSYRIENKGLNFEIKQYQPIDQLLYADKRKIKQVLVNLLSNSIKFTEQGEIAISIDHQNIGDQKIKITIKVKDTGIGIRQEDRKRIFAYFEQGTNEINKNSGTGLGMAISKQYAQLIEGDVKLEQSEVGNGSTFVFDFVATISKEQILHSINPNQSIKTIKHKQNAPKILIADHDSENLSLLSLILKDVGFIVYTARDGIKAFDLFVEKEPDLIFMSTKLPLQDGLETANRIRTTDKGIQTKIFFISASTFDDQLNAKIEQSEIDGIVLKPYNINDIYQLLEQNLAVEFEYHSLPKEKNVKQTHFNNQDLIQKLPKTWCKKTIESIHQGDIENLQNLIKNLSPEVSALQPMFNQFLDEYNYQKFLELLVSRLDDE